MKTISAFSLAFILFLGSAAGSLAVTPEMIRKADQMKQTAIDFLNKGKYNKAIPLLKDILSINPTDKTAARYLLLAKQQMAEPICKQAADAYLGDDYPKAIEFWENILKINPDDRRIVDLIESTRNLVQDNSLDAMYALVDRLFKEEKYHLAVNELQKILVINPEEQKAQDLLKSAARAIIDSEVKAHYEKADQFLKQKRYDLAIEEWREVLKIDPEQDGASRLIASTIRKTFLDSSYGKAEKLFVEGKYTASLEQYNKILIDNPTDQYVKKIVARLNDVLKVAPRVEKQGPGWDMLRKSLANYISMDGSQRVALAAVWYAVQLDPENNLALSARDFLEHELITVVRTMEYPVRDMNIIDQYLFAALNNIYSGRYDIAIQECSIVLELQPKNVLALKRLGSAYFAMKNKEKARETWEKALRLAPDDNELKKFIHESRSSDSQDTEKKKKR